MPATKEHINEVLDSIARRNRGPGGAIAVLKDGELLAQRVWGFADLSQRIPLSPRTQLPICSITKQFICALILDLERTPLPGPSIRSQLAAQLSEILPELSDKITIDHLCHMQSGLRDYWAMTTLLGAKPDDEFLIQRDGPGMAARAKSVQFKPGSEFSYCNLNFYILGRALERVTGKSLDELLQERILRPAGMETAFLCPNTAEHPAPCVGYEGDERGGFMPAVNRMEWAGDAGLVASLADMIAYEKYLDRCYADSESWYREAIEGPVFGDGTPAPYKFGLSHGHIGGVKTVGHGGALRGYRLERRHVPTERLSVVVLLNSDADSSEPGVEIIREVLDIPKPALSDVKPADDWFGAFMDQDTQLAIVVSKGAREGEVAISYAGEAENITLSEPNHGKNDAMVATIDGDSLDIHRVEDNRRLRAHRIVPDESILKKTPFHGVYHCAEIESTFHCIGEAGTFYGAFDGYLGQGHATPMKYLGGDVWVLTCPRGLDAPAPGDWTVNFHRDENNTVNGLTIGCWLARGIEYIKKI
ncbi:unnamed protein product [Penicillium olsonii]|uniref:D-aminopeptidase n=1 Tax=Penicillium olsonii TaxID=99116 RepID=A0A9W4HLR2_PENOL|nr:unnamed protein product [Penicillium olsonii]CAG8081931.1 unnamed protein product [Penicillium olsonii]